jgi:hypothetical protein
LAERFEGWLQTHQESLVLGPPIGLLAALLLPWLADRLGFDKALQEAFPGSKSDFQKARFWSLLVTASGWFGVGFPSVVLASQVLAAFGLPQVVALFVCFFAIAYPFLFGVKFVSEHLPRIGPRVRAYHKAAKDAGLGFGG